MYRKTYHLRSSHGPVIGGLQCEDASKELGRQVRDSCASNTIYEPVISYSCLLYLDMGKLNIGITLRQFACGRRISNTNFVA